MTKKKILNKQELNLKDIPVLKINKEYVSELQEINPTQTFKNHAKVAEALLHCLLENDPEAFIEILDTYLKVNRSKVAKDAQLSRATVQLALSGRGNPTLKTIAKIVHHEAGSTRNKNLS